MEFFGCGNISKYNNAFYYRVEKFSDIKNKIIPFFNQYQVKGTKYQDYLDFCKGAELISNIAFNKKRYWGNKGN